MFELRLRRLLFVLCVVLGIVFGRAFSLQVVQARELVGRYEQSRSTSSFRIPRRGDILFADGAPMVENDSAFTVHVGPKSLVTPRFECDGCGRTTLARERAGAPVPPKSCGECGGAAHSLRPSADLDALAALIGIDRASLDAKLAALGAAQKKARLATRMLRGVRLSRDRAMALALRAHEFPSLLIVAERLRVADPSVRSVVGRTRRPSRADVQALSAPERELRGRVAFTETEALQVLVGTSGLERAYDESLRGAPGRVRRTSAGRGADASAVVVEREVEDGRPVRTTLRRTVQQAAFDLCAVGEGVATSAVVLDLRDGAVVALASRSDDGLNHALVRLVPGSVMKLATALAVLEKGVDPSLTVSCAGSGWMRPGVRYKCTGVHPSIALEEAFAHSCNLYFMQRAEDVGGPAFLDACERLGFFLPVDLGVATPVPGTVARSGADEVRFLGIGQGPVAVTPLHVATAFARLATGGRRIVPYLDRDRGADPASRSIDPVIARHAPRLQDAARRVVVHGTAWRAESLRTVEAAGKSGSAEVELSRQPRGADGRVAKTLNAWFVGYAPATAPRYVAVVVHEHVGRHGAELAGPEVGRLLEAALGER